MNYMNIRLAKIEDVDFIKKLHKQSSKQIGGFNLFWVWDKYIKKEAKHKYVIIEDTDCKQKGVGKALYNYIPKPIMLKCNQDNEAGNLFYNNMGMTKAGKTKTLAGVNQNIWWAT